MTRIVDVVVHRRRVPFTRPFITAVRRADALDAVLIEILDSDGRSGWGEAVATWRVTGESVASITAAVEGPWRATLRGATLDDPSSLCERLRREVVGNPSARSALGCALVDLAARGEGIPLYDYLGGTSDTVTTDMTLSAVLDADVADLIARAQAYVADGFTTLKVKLGAGGDDVATMARLRRALGPAVELRADANQAWTTTQAVSTIRALEDAGVGLAYVEQPVARHDLAAMASVRAAVATPIMVDEGVWTIDELHEVIRRAAADLVNLKLAKSGGPFEVLDLARAAQAGGLEVLMGCMAESHVGVSAAGALASVLDATASSSSRVHDLDGGTWLAASPVRHGAHYEGSQLILGPGPGSGIDGLVDT